MATGDANRAVAELKGQADRALAGRDPATAAALFERALELAPRRLDVWMGLAACRRMLGDPPRSLAAVDCALAVDPRFYAGLLMKASLLEQLGAPHQAGAAYGVALTQAPEAEQLADGLRAATVRGREIFARYQEALAQALRDGLGVEAALSGASGRRLNRFIDQLAGRRRVFHQAPAQFHYPGLPEIEFHDRDDFPWIEEFEAATSDIHRELVGVFDEDGAGLEPYIDYPDHAPLDQWAELNRSPLWSAYHLLAGGNRVEAHAARCPKTMAALARLPQPDLSNRSPAAMFSVLQPHTRIPPHHGVANTRLVVHLPLIVPPGCDFRVGNETRTWETGEAWVFDDTIEHEAGNASDRPRTILICDVWNPRLDEDERRLISQLTAAMDAFANDAPAGGGL